MSKTMKVFLACFLGGFIGTIVALQLHAFWWLGLLIGSFVGYLTYEAKQVVCAIKQSWKTVIGIRIISRKQWKKFTRMLYDSAKLILVACSIFASFIVCILPVFLLKNPFGVALSLGLCIILSIARIIDVTRDKDDPLTTCLHLNPIYLYLWLTPKYLIIGIVWLLKLIFHVIPRTPKFLAKTTKIIGRFIKTVFILIHSDELLLCGIDAAIGTVIGFITGNAVVGGLAGGVFGVLNFEIISKRILHLVPAKSKN